MAEKEGIACAKLARRIYGFLSFDFAELLLTEVCVCGILNYFITPLCVLVVLCLGPERVLIIFGDDLICAVLRLQFA